MARKSYWLVSSTKIFLRTLLEASEIISEAQAQELSREEIIDRVQKHTGKSKDILSKMWEQAHAIAMKLFHNEKAPGFQAGVISKFVAMAL